MIVQLIGENLVICANGNINSIISSKPCISIDCSINWNESQKKIIDIDDACTVKCSDYIFSSYAYENKCYHECQKGNYSNNLFFKYSEFYTRNIALNNIILCKDINTCKIRDFFLGICILNNSNPDYQD